MRRNRFGLSPTHSGALLTALLSLSSSVASAEDPREIRLGEGSRLVPTAEIRVRGEYRRDAPELGGVAPSGGDSGGVRDSWAAFSRARLGALFERGPVGIKLTLQDARVWGTSVPGIVPQAGDGYASTGAYEAYAEIHGEATRPRFLRVGRQAIAWGDGSLVGNGDWLATGRSLDAVRAVYSTQSFVVDGFATLLEPASPMGPALINHAGPSRSGTQLYALRVEYNEWPALNIQAMGFARISRASSLGLDGSRFLAARQDSDTFTGALALSGEVSKILYRAVGAYQGGHSSSLGGATISAWAAKLWIERRVDEWLLSPTFHFGGSYASGDDGGSDYNQFDPILPDPWTHYGAMDAFAWSNVVEAHGRVAISPWTDVDLFAEYRYARLANERGEWVNGFLSTIARPGGAGPLFGTGVATSAPSSELGHQIDAGLSMRPWSQVSVRAGYSVLFFGDGAKTLLAGVRRGEADAAGVVTARSAAHLGYLALTVQLP